METKTLGFDEVAERASASDKDFTFLGGQLPDEILVDDGDWRPYRPKLEIQKNNVFDTYSCVSFANNNSTEYIHIKRYGKEVNDSDRFLSVISGTVPGRGNSHTNVAESRRKKGSVEEEAYPFTDNMTQNEFYKYPPKDILEEGLQWLETTEYGYMRVRRDAFKEALRRGPVQVAVDSRTAKKSQFKSYDHSVVLEHIDEEGRNYIFDNYLNRHLVYDKGYPFSYGMLHTYKKKLMVQIDKYEMQLVRSKTSGRIYFIDSDGRAHWVDTPASFAAFFGTSAWNRKGWIAIGEGEMESFGRGEDISVKKSLLWSKLRELFLTFGRKK